LLFAAFALAHSLMMMFMMAGVHGGTDSTAERRSPALDDRNQQSTGDRR
jgi:hypothetical protein